MGWDCCSFAGDTDVSSLTVPRPERRRHAVPKHLLPALLFAGAGVLWVLRRSRLTTRTQLLLLAVWGAVGVFLIIAVER